MTFKLMDALYRDFGEVTINTIEDLQKIQNDCEHNPDKDQLIIDFSDMTIMIYNSWIE